MLNGVNGSTNFAIPMSILIGDTNGNGTATITFILISCSTNDMDTI
jgi:hypothetical protein